MNPKPRHARPVAAPGSRSLAGFSLLEVMFALALSGIVILGATSLFWMAESTDKRLADRFDDQIALAHTQSVLRRAFATLVASPPVDPPPEDGQPGGDEDPDDEDPDAEEEQPGLSAEQQAHRERLAAIVETLGGDQALVHSVLRSNAYERANFEIYYDITPQGRTLPHLELTLMRPPVAPPAEYGELVQVGIAGDKIRGSFDLIEEGETLTLVWQPIDPPGLPTPLVRDLVWAEWWTLPRKRHGAEWLDVYAAFIEERYPVAVRIALWTSSGTHVDWLFETAVTTPNQ